MTPRDPWWRGLGPGDEQAPAECEPTECPYCCWTGADDCGWPCDACGGSGYGGEDEDSRAECDAWEGLL